MTTPIDRPVITLRTVFLAQPDAVVLPDGSGTASCPLCGTAGAAVMFAEPGWPEVVCTAGGPHCPARGDVAPIRTQDRRMTP